MIGEAMATFSFYPDGSFQGGHGQRKQFERSDFQDKGADGQCDDNAGR